MLFLWTQDLFKQVMVFKQMSMITIRQFLLSALLSHYSHYVLLLVKDIYYIYIYIAVKGGGNT